MIGKFFKGLASTGAWCCFDEFNRIYVEVLSVIAQLLLLLFQSKRNLDVTIDFEGSIILMQHSFSIFVTMNPGYKGKVELPDNLKSLFRQVAMMVPNYYMITEIMLYSFGFQNGRDLAKKIITTFSIAQEQLSDQVHYDYGMRAVKSLISLAGQFKELFWNESEEQLILRAMREVNLPKLIKEDTELFKNILIDQFEGAAMRN
jgi:dynein heavy chain